MSVKIRLARGGAKKTPFYRIVVADERKSRDGKFIEKVGTFNPLLANDNPARLTLRKDRIEYWLSVGARPTERVVSFLNQTNVAQENNHVKTANQKRSNVIELKRVEIEAKKKADAEAAAKAEAEAKAAAEAEAKEKAEAEAKAAEEAKAAAQAAEATPAEPAAEASQA